ncbi:hypothetical protein PENTCL1PPCAC_6099, partial [Pristionchus entomophagus]
LESAVEGNSKSPTKLSTPRKNKKSPPNFKFCCGCHCKTAVRLFSVFRAFITAIVLVTVIVSHEITQKETSDSMISSSSISVWLKLLSISSLLLSSGREHLPPREPVFLAMAWQKLSSASSG